MKRQLKQTLTILLITTLLVCLFPGGAWAEADRQEISSIPEETMSLQKINSISTMMEDLDLAAVESEQTATAGECIQTTAVAGDYEYTVVDEGATITRYKGANVNVTVPGTLGGLPVKKIGEKAFYYGRGLTSISLPESVISIGGDAFSYCDRLTRINLPHGLTSIGDSAFNYCSSLTSISLPHGLTSIGIGAFGNCSSLTSISLPESVASIGYGAFADCSNLTQLTVAVENANYQSVDGVLYNKTQTVLLACLVGTTSVSLPESLTSIENYAFFNCSSLTDISLPERCADIGGAAFAGCSSLTSIGLPQSVTTIGYGTFFECGSLTNVSLPENLVSISEYAFADCSSLMSISLPESCTSVGEDAFTNCSSLKSIRFNSAKTLINGDSNTARTIPITATIIGYAPSTAQAYADKNGNPFQLIGVSSAGVEYRGHVQNKGEYPLNGSYIQGPKQLGTVGEGLRLEAFWIRLTNAPAGLHIKYQVHVQNKGWLAPVEDGKLGGTEGEGLRIEAIKISLVDDEGNLSKDYSVAYKGHVQNQGDTKWYANGEQLGTTASGLRLEALEVQITKTTAE